MSRAVEAVCAVLIVVLHFLAMAVMVVFGIIGTICVLIFIWYEDQPTWLKTSIKVTVFLAAIVLLWRAFA